MEDLKRNRLKICIFSPNFFPMVGGLETVTVDIANGLVEQGCEVKIITLTPIGKHENVDFAFEVYRTPHLLKAIRIVYWADIFLMFNVSLKGMHLWLLSGKPLIISHHTLNPSSILGRFKNFISNHIAKANIGCSRYMAAHFKNAVAIGNPYDGELFSITTPWNDRPLDFVFLGRLVSDKGGDLFIRAMEKIKGKGYKIRASIIGAGPEYKRLVRLSEDLELTGELQFYGVKKGKDLVDLLNQHKIMVIPSLWEEPFGLVALEGIATGCIVIGSEGGGLKEAIGSCGLTFPNGDLNELVQRICDLLEDDHVSTKYLSNATEHLKKHSIPFVSQEYLRVLKRFSKIF